MKHRIRWIAAIIMILASLQLVGCAPAPAAQAKVAPSKLETIEGSEFKRVVLTEKAVERLQIQTIAVRAEPVTRTWLVGGEVVAMATDPSAMASSAAGAVVNARTADLTRVHVRVNLSEKELSKVDRSQPAHVRVLRSDDDEDEDSDLEAELDDTDDINDVEETSLPAGAASLFYTVNNANAALAPGQPVLVNITLAGGGAERKIVPFASLLYGVHGETWVYTSPEPLVFVRTPVTVDFIEHNLAYLTEGPAAGTEVVTVGGSLLYGTETGVSK